MTAVRICSGLPFSIWLIVKDEKTSESQTGKQSSINLNVKYEPPSLTVFKLGSPKNCEGGPIPSSFEKHIYNALALALGIAHSAVGEPQMRRTIRLALALALELDDELATALALRGGVSF